MAATQTDKAQPPTLVVGLGATGLSVARFLAARGVPFAVADSRPAPPGLDRVRREWPQAELLLGPFDAERFSAAQTLVLSPGIARSEPAVAAALAAGVEVIGDIELFARYADAPVIAVTGSNGKSTVTTLVGEMARAGGIDVRVGGNLGTPALDLLGPTAPELYVVELSSFQLESTSSLAPQAAVVLNVSADHLDRHADLASYAAIKRSVYRGEGTMVINLDDPRVAAMARAGRAVIPFTLGVPPANGYGIGEHNGGACLARGGDCLLPLAELRLAGRHNQANALAALALAEAAGIPREAQLKALRAFAGLPHRCQWVAQAHDIAWYNDSKGTNVGATLAALAGMPGGRVVLIAGGEGKGQDFTLLRAAVAERARAVVLIGRDAPLIAAAIGDAAPLQYAGDMAAAVRAAAAAARPGDSVLLSPACASFDMFANYVARGEAFAAAVREVAR